MEKRKQIENRIKNYRKQVLEIKAKKEITESDKKALEVLNSVIIDLTFQQKQMFKAYNQKRKNCQDDDTLDLLQDSIIDMIEIEKRGKIDKPKQLFSKIISNTRKDKYKKGLTVDLETNEPVKIIEISSPITEVLQDNLLDIDDKQSYRDTIEYINSKLTDIEKTLFGFYFQSGMSTREISAKINIPKTEVIRKIKNLSAKLHRLKISELYDTRYSQTTQYRIKYPTFKPEKTCKDSGKIFSKNECKGYKLQEQLVRQVNDSEYALRIKPNYSTPLNYAKNWGLNIATND